MLVLSICSWILDVAHQGKEAEVVVGPSNYCTFVPVHVLLPFLYLSAAPFVDWSDSIWGLFSWVWMTLLE